MNKTKFLIFGQYVSKLIYIIMEAIIALEKLHTYVLKNTFIDNYCISANYKVVNNHFQT